MQMTKIFSGGLFAAGLVLLGGLEADAAVVGKVLDSAGQGVSGAAVIVVPKGQSVQLEGAKFDAESAGFAHARSGDDGGFNFDEDAEGGAVLVLADSGYGVGEIAADGPVDVRLQDWANVKGKLKLTGVDASECNVMIGTQVYPDHMPFQGVTVIGFEKVVEVGDAGVFELAKVPIGRYGYASVVYGQGDHRNAVIDTVRIGAEGEKEIDVVLGESGVRGELAVRNEAGEVFGEGWEGAGVIAMPDYDRAEMSPPFPDDFAKKSPEEKVAWFIGWLRSDEGLAYSDKYHAMMTAMRGGVYDAKAGQVDFYNLKPGKYRLRGAMVNRKAGGDPARFAKQFSVSDGDEQGGVVAIGEVEVVVPKSLNEGQMAPDFEVPTLDGGKFKLSDQRGKYVLIDFWATWCGPCLGETPNIKKTWEAFKGRDDFEIVALSLDKDQAAPTKYAKEKGLDYVQGFLGDWGSNGVTDLYNVRGIPSIWLIGPDGKVVAKGLRGARIYAEVRAALGAE